MKMSWMSRRRAGRPSMRYSLSPERKRRRVMVISPGRFGWASATAGLMDGVGLVHLRVHQGHGDVGHAQRLAVARAGEDHVFHAGAAQGSGGLFAEHPTDGVADVGLAAAVRTDDGGDAFSVEAEFGALAERFESLHFYAFQFQQRRSPRLGRGSSCNHTKRADGKSKARSLQDAVAVEIGVQDVGVRCLGPQEPAGVR